MAAKDWPMSRVKKIWDSYRKKYFMDGQGRVPPLAKNLRWSWLPFGSSIAGVTHFDVDDEPESIELNEGLRNWPHELRRVILHELTHCRLGPKLECPSTGASVLTGLPVPATWRDETVRLAALGAPLL